MRRVIPVAVRARAVQRHCATAASSTHQAPTSAASVSSLIADLQAMDTASVSHCTRRSAPEPPGGASQNRPPASPAVAAPPAVKTACAVCGKTFFNAKVLEAHMVRRHRRQTTTDAASFSVAADDVQEAEGNVSPSAATASAPASGSEHLTEKAMAQDGGEPSGELPPAPPAPELEEAWPSIDTVIPSSPPTISAAQSTTASTYRSVQKKRHHLRATLAAAEAEMALRKAYAVLASYKRRGAAQRAEEQSAGAPPSPELADALAAATQSGTIGKVNEDITASGEELESESTDAISDADTPAIPSTKSMGGTDVVDGETEAVPEVSGRGQQSGNGFVEEDATRGVGVRPSGEVELRAMQETIVDPVATDPRPFGFHAPLDAVDALLRKHPGAARVGGSMELQIDGVICESVFGAVPDPNPVSATEVGQKVPCLRLVVERLSFKQDPADTRLVPRIDRFHARLYGRMAGLKLTPGDRVMAIGNLGLHPTYDLVGRKWHDHPTLHVSEPSGRIVRMGKGKVMLGAPVGQQPADPQAEGQMPAAPISV